MLLTGYKVMIFAEPDLAVELFIILSGFTDDLSLPL